MAYQSNADFLAELRDLIDAWCDRRCLQALLRILTGYLSFNGMNDGWGEVRSGLVQVRALARDELTETELQTVSRLIATVDQLLPR